MGARLVIAGGPPRQRLSGVVEIVEDRFIEQFVAHTEPPAAGNLVMDEIHRPASVRLFGLDSTTIGAP
jgi:hypothetical protein